MSDRDTSRDLLARLERHYIKPGEAMPGGMFVPECGINGAWGAASRCDALYAGFTSSSGRILIGHELKVSRSDWRNEVNKPGKADTWADQCHAWYVVAPSTDVVPVEEVPAGWGLMVINPRSRVRLDVKIKATVKTDHQPSWDAVRSIMARQDTLRAQAIAEGRAKAREEEHAAAEKRQLAEIERAQHLTPEQAERLRCLDLIEERLGVKVGRWGDDAQVRPEHVAAALQLVRAGDGLPRDRFTLENLRRWTQQIDQALTELAPAVSAWRGLVDPPPNELTTRRRA